MGSGTLTETLIGIALLVAGYILRHYGVKLPGLPGKPSPAGPATPEPVPGPTVPQRGPVLTAVLAFLSARLGIPLPVLLDSVQPVKPTELVQSGPVDSDADIALAVTLLQRHLPASGGDAGSK